MNQRSLTTHIDDSSKKRKVGWEDLQRPRYFTRVSNKMSVYIFASHKVSTFGYGRLVVTERKIGDSLGCLYFSSILLLMPPFTVVDQFEYVSATDRRKT